MTRVPAAARSRAGKIALTSKAMQQMTGRRPARRGRASSRPSCIPRLPAPRSRRVPPPGRRVRGRRAPRRRSAGDRRAVDPRHGGGPRSPPASPPSSWWRTGTPTTRPSTPSRSIAQNAWNGGVVLGSARHGVARRRPRARRHALRGSTARPPARARPATRSGHPVRGRRVAREPPQRPRRHASRAG